MATDAALRYLIESNDRDLKETRRSVLALNKALGAAEPAGTTGAKGIDRIGRSSGKSTALLGGLGKASKLLGLGLVGLAGAAAVGGAKMVGLASDAAEVDSKMKVVYGKTLPGLNKELDRFANKTGASRYEMREQAADMGALLKPLLGSQKETAKTSAQFVKLANDLGSFNNVPTADALQAIRSGLVGEAEPLRRFGVLINDAAVKSEAYRLGIAKTGAELTEQQKVQARASLIMQQTTLAQGDAERTAGGMANQMKALKNNVKDAATSLGVSLIPIALKAVTAFNTHWPTIERIASQVLGAIVTQVTRLVTWFQANWPTIQRVALAVFGALKRTWESVLAPALRAIGAGIEWLVKQAIKYWPQIRAAAESVMKWYRSTLQPTIMSVVDTLTRLWEKFGGSITAVARAAFGILTTIVGGALKTLKAVIDTALALLRGDWGKAWEGLKTIVSTALGTLLSVIKQYVTKLLPAMVGLGFDIIAGIGKGITQGAYNVIKKAIEWATDQIPGWAKKVLGIGSPSRRMAAEVGIPISEGIAKGMMSGAVKVDQAMVDLANNALDKARSSVQAKMGNFGSFVSRSFGERQAGAQTPAEKRLAAIDARRQQESLKRGLGDADAAVKQARIDEASFKPEEGMTAADAERRRAELRRATLDAERAHATAKEDITISKLQETAAKERQVLEARQFVEQQKFDQRLASLQSYLESGQATAKGATTRIHKLLDDFGIDMGKLGVASGKQYAQGLRDSIPAVVAAALDLRSSAKDAKIVGTASAAQKAKEEAAAKAKSATSAASGGAGASVGPVSGGLIDIGRQLQKLGFQVGEHPSFGGVDPVHTDGSYHYRGRAIDINWPGGGPAELSKLQGAFASLKARGGFVELMIEDAGRANQHLHAAMARGGIVHGARLGDTGAAARRLEAVVPLESAHGQRQLAAALEQALRGQGAGPLVKIEEYHDHSGAGPQELGSAVWRALAIR